MRIVLVIGIVVAVLSGCTSTGSTSSVPTADPPMATGTPKTTVGPSPTPSVPAFSPAVASSTPAGPTLTTSPSPLPPVSPDPTATPMPSVPPPLDQARRMDAIGSSGTRFVLAGATTDAGDGSRDALAFWTSQDGFTWTEGSERSSGVATEFAFDPTGGGIAVGYEGAGAAVWATGDGIEWSRVPDQPALRPLDGEASIRLRHVARADGGYIAVGESGPWAVILMSTDGLTWSRSSATPSLTRVTLESIAGAQGGFVLTGHARSPWRNAIWYSADGAAWSEIRDVPQERGRYGNSGIVVSGPQGWLLKSQTYEGDGLWVSQDGEDWTFIAEPGDPADQIAALVPAPGRYVVVEPSGRCSSGVWTSPDARAWACAESAAESATAPDGLIYDWKFAASDRTIVGIRETGPPWIADLGD